MSEKRKYSSSNRLDEKKATYSFHIPRRSSIISCSQSIHSNYCYDTETYHDEQQQKISVSFQLISSFKVKNLPFPRRYKILVVVAGPHTLYTISAANSSATAYRKVRQHQES